MTTPEPSAERHLYTAPNGHEYWCWCDSPPEPSAADAGLPLTTLEGVPHVPTVCCNEHWASRPATPPEDNA